MSVNSEFEGIEIKGAREHNLKNITTRIPRNQITVVTGLSGSGKSSLAFDTIYAEGQRRYVESLSAYARNFLEQLKKPEVDAITGLSPAIAIEQKTGSTNPRSTVGTVTEVYDYLRLLYARSGVPFCPNCNIPVSRQDEEQIIADIMKLPAETKFHVLAPMAKGKKGEFHNEFQKWIRLGFVRAKVDGEYIEISETQKLKKTKHHDIDLLIDRLIMKESARARINESVRTALKLSGGTVTIEFNNTAKTYSMLTACSKCGFNFPEIEPRFFSFNNPRGACQSCNGLGVVEVGVEPEHDEDEENEDFDEVTYIGCAACNGTRLRREALSVYLKGKNIAELAEMSVDKLTAFLKTITWSSREAVITEKIINQVFFRLEYMSKVGVAYLSLDRPLRTLSGGEAQRVRLATQIGSSLVGVLYVLDEPSIGLHPRDHTRLLKTLADLRDRGNTVLLVEHDEDTIRMADHIIDLGPRAGALGGELIAQGPLESILKNRESLTAKYLNGELLTSPKREFRKGNGKFLSIEGATEHNLKNVTLKIPLGTLTSVTGVSGSGKSTIIIETLYKATSKHFYDSNVVPAEHKRIVGLEHLDKVVEINQKPIGRTPRSNPATYVGLFSLIRALYSEHPESKLRGYKPGRFSFNVKGGRCEACMGGGMVKIEMHFMPDVFVPCDVCGGQRYNKETLSIRYKGKSISDVLNMSVAEALTFFENHPVIHRKLETLHRVGLDYITLGQSSTTLSGGEAQRIKLSRELSKSATGRTLYILDEPTTGLHFDDVKKLIDLLHELVEQGNTVVVIEHNLDVIKSSDYVIDMGPEGGDKGGEIVAQGNPREVAKVKSSYTGQFLARAL
ncbi:MAG TPA: excinuclease ABC subunit UvrA [Bdellovibrionales bacterium]|nr:excinuclease ABC subunit UvrA [Bdellovibrionales bacterium]